jgi:uncharacterized protein YutE (UPF0331/DUF86 family)
MPSSRGTVVDESVMSKVEAIERSLERVRVEYRGDPARLENQTVEDAILLNLQRACEAAIKIAMRVVARRRLGVPQESRAAFEMMEAAGILTPDLAARMKRMVGFRNIAIHEYQRLDRAVLESILRERLGDFTEFCQAAIEASEGGP